MQPARFRQEDILLVEITMLRSTSPAVSSGEERGLLSRTAAGNRAYGKVRLIQLLDYLSVASPESGLFSDWSRNKRYLELSH